MQRNSLSNYAAKVWQSCVFSKDIYKILTPIMLVFFCTKVCTRLCTNLKSNVSVNSL